MSFDSGGIREKAWSAELVKVRSIVGGTELTKGESTLVGCAYALSLA